MRILQVFIYRIGVWIFLITMYLGSCSEDLYLSILFVLMIKSWEFHTRIVPSVSHLTLEIDMWNYLFLCVYTLLFLPIQLTHRSQSPPFWGCLFCTIFQMVTTFSWPFRCFGQMQIEVDKYIQQMHLLRPHFYPGPLFILWEISQKERDILTVGACWAQYNCMTITRKTCGSCGDW